MKISVLNVDSSHTAPHKLTAEVQFLAVQPANHVADGTRCRQMNQRNRNPSSEWIKKEKTHRKWVTEPEPVPTFTSKTLAQPGPAREYPTGPVGRRSGIPPLVGIHKKCQSMKTLTFTHLHKLFVVLHVAFQPVQHHPSGTIPFHFID